MGKRFGRLGSSASGDWRRFYSLYISRPLIQYTNQFGKVTLYDYDALNRKVAQTNANGLFPFHPFKALKEIFSGEEPKPAPAPEAKPPAP